MQEVDGKSLRDHLESWGRQMGQVHPMLANAQSLPAGCDQLWADFMALHNSRSFTGFGPARITFTDIDAFQRVQGVRLPAWQIDAIRRADNAYLTHHAETARPKRK